MTEDNPRTGWFYRDELPPDDDAYFENMARTVFQAGLSWKLISDKWNDFKIAFKDFKIDQVSDFDDEDIEELKENLSKDSIIKTRFDIHKNLESALKSLELNSGEDAMMSSKKMGTSTSESPVDKLKKVAKADIIMQLTWIINQTGPKKSVTFNLQGLDAYTNKQVATASGTGVPSFSAEVAILLEEAVLSHIDNFNSSLMYHFDDLFANGREVVIRIKKWDNWEEDLESEFGSNDEELGIIIEDWMADYTVNGRFSTTDASENMMLFEQVRIPLYYEKNGKQRAMDTRRFAIKLSSFLKKEPYNIVNKVTTTGLGRATIYLGSK